MAERSKSIVDSIKNRINKQGNSKDDIFYLKGGNKVRVRFLNDMEGGHTIKFHDKWGEFCHPCLSYYNQKCPNCKNAEARHLENYAWSVYNYETKKVELFLFKANKASPIPALISLYEAYGTIVDRDFVVQRNGEGKDTTYTVTPMDKSRFKFADEKKGFKKVKVYDILLAAFPYEDGAGDEDEDDDDEDEDDDVHATKKSKSKPAAKKKKSRDDDDDDDDDEDDVPFDVDDDDEDDDEDEPPKKSKKKAPVKKKPAAKKKPVYEEDDDEDEDDEDEDDEEDDEDELPAPKKKTTKRR